MGVLTVHHFGPDPDSVGGMARVIGLCVEHRIGADRVLAHPTWRPEARSASAWLAVRSAARLRRMPPGQIVHVHLSERGSFLREGALVMLARRRRLTVVITLHGADFLPSAARYPRLVRAVLRRAHLISCLDPDVRASVARLAPQVRCEIVPNPVPVDERSIPADQTDELVLFAGEISCRKGADILHRAWPIVAKRRPSARCVMVGPDGGLALSPLERLRIEPPTDPEAIKQLLIRARVIALPSRAEGMPMILTEAMALARPFVSTPVGGIPQLAEGGGGTLVPVEDHEALAERLIELLANPSMARDVGERGRRRVEKTRSLPVIDQRWRGLYAGAAEDAGDIAHSSTIASDRPERKRV